MAKYDPLRDHLQGSLAERITLTFRNIEKILGEPLAPYARAGDARWWENEEDTGYHVQARAWRDAGYRVTHVDFTNELVAFERIPAEAVVSDDE